MNIFSHFPYFQTSPLDLKTWTAILPSFEFMNFVVALIVWSSRYPSVFWSTSKSFAFIFSIQMIANAIDLLFVFAGVTVVYKLQIVGQKLPLQVCISILIDFLFIIHSFYYLTFLFNFADTAITVEWNCFVTFIHFINIIDNIIVNDFIFVWPW